MIAVGTSELITAGVAVAVFVTGSIIRPISGKAKEAAVTAAKLATSNSESAAKLIVDAATAANKLAMDSAAAAANLNLSSALRNQKVDDRIASLVSTQLSHDRRIGVLEDRADH